MKKILFIIFLLIAPSLVFADNSVGKQNNYYRAKVLEVIKEEKSISDGGAESIQQNLKLKGLEGNIKNKEIIFEGISNLDVISKNIYKAGDEVLVVESFGDNGQANYYVVDYVRTKYIYWLFFIFAASILLVGRMKGIKSLISLALTFFVIIKYIIPQILDGADPIIVTLFGSLAILVLIIYMTEGFNAKSHLASISILFSLVITIFLSWIFVELMRLTGASSEDTASLVDLGGQAVNFQGLLLAGIIIGALGVLDDVVVSQISAVEELNKSNANLSKIHIFKSAYNVGVSHISSMSNTLFLAYAGVSMPLLILFLSGQSAFTNWTQIINNEDIAVEIVRTLAGSIGLILSVPISTALAVWWFKRKID